MIRFVYLLVVTLYLCPYFDTRTSEGDFISQLSLLPMREVIRADIGTPRHIRPWTQIEVADHQALVSIDTTLDLTQSPTNCTLVNRQLLARINRARVARVSSDGQSLIYDDDDTSRQVIKTIEAESVPAILFYFDSTTPKRVNIR